jgi:endonuclease YncB( thermonuclease family)
VRIVLLKSVSRVGLLLVAMLLSLPASNGRCLLFETFQGKVVTVKDGDSIVVLRDRKEVQVRLNGVDAPEKGQAFGNRAKKFTQASCYNSLVTVREVGLDRYGRTLAEVTLPDGRSLNQEIVRAGYAWWFRRYSNDEALLRLEAEARSARRGLWVDRDPIPPWEYRHPTASVETEIRQTPATSPAPATNEGSVVYVTSSGTKYHAKTCTALQGRGVAIPYSQAVGTYEPCAICGGK